MHMLQNERRLLRPPTTLIRRRHPDPLSLAALPHEFATTVTGSVPVLHAVKVEQPMTSPHLNTLLPQPHAESRNDSIHLRRLVLPSPP